MITDNLEKGLNELVRTTCDFLATMGEVTAIDGLDDDGLLEYWLNEGKLRQTGFSWAKQSGLFAEEFVDAVVISCKGPEAAYLRSVWEGDGESKINLDGFIEKHSEGFAVLISESNENLSIDGAKRMLRRIGQGEGGHWDRGFRNYLEHMHERGSDAERTREKFIRFEYGRITHERVFSLTEELVQLYDCAKGNALGKTKLVDLINSHLEMEKEPERHSAWFVFKRLDELDWTHYVETRNLTGPSGLITAVAHDNLITVVGDGGLGKTALVNEFIRRNYKGQTSFIDGEKAVKVDPFQHVIIFSSKSKKQGEYNTLDGGGNLLDPADPRKSVRQFLHPGSYEDFIESIYSLDRVGSKEPGEKNEEYALRVLENFNVLVVLDNYEDIERDSQYAEDKSQFELFLDKWGKKLVFGPKGRVIMTSRTGLEQFRRTGVVKMENLDAMRSKELLRERYIWLHEQFSTQPSKSMLESVLDAKSKLFDQILEEEDLFREQLWGHPLLIQLFAMLLKEEDENEPGGRGRVKVNRVIGKLRESGSIGDVYKYIVKKTVDVLFCDEKDAYLFEIMLKEEDWVSVQQLIELADGGPSITFSDVTSFRDKLEGLGWLDEENTEGREGYPFRISFRYRTQVGLSRGDVRDEDDNRVVSEPQEELEDWQKFFQVEAICEDDVSAPNYRDYKTLERICRRLLGEDTNARLGLDSDILRISESGLSHRKILLFENMILANEIVGKYTREELENMILANEIVGVGNYTREELEKYGERVVHAIKKLDLEVSRTMLRFVRDIGKGRYAWQSVTEPTGRQIRKVISRLALNPDQFDNVKEDIPLFIDGLHKIVDTWRPVEDISKNYQLDEILHSWGQHLAVEWDFSEDDEEMGLEYRSWWIEIAWDLWESDVGLNFPLLGSMLSNYLLDQEELDEAGDAERYSKMLEEMQRHPLFCDHADLDRFAEQGVGRRFNLDDEEDRSKLNEAWPGDVLYIPEEDSWGPSKTGGSYEEYRLGNQIICRDPVSSGASGGDWLVSMRDALGIKVTLHRAMEPDEFEDSGLRHEPAKIIDWVEDFLRKQDDYITTALLGEKVSREFGVKISSYLKDQDLGKLVEFLKSSRLGSRISFRPNKGDPWNKIRLLEEGLNKLTDVAIEKTTILHSGTGLRMPGDLEATAKCIEFISEALAVNRKWHPGEISKGIAKKLRAEGVESHMNWHRSHAYRVIVGMYLEAVELKVASKADIDVSPERLLEINFNHLIESQRVSDEELENWSDGVTGHLKPTGEIIVPLPLISTDTNNAPEYESYTVPKLKAMCKERGIERYSRLKKAELIDRLKESSSD